MATNPYFTQGTRSEQTLYEDIIIESLKIYGQDVYYIPREIVGRDRIFDDDAVSRFDNAYKIEMYIENIEGFDGEGDLFTKFGVEIRDAATFVVAKRRWNNAIAQYEETDDNTFFRPREGDLIHLPLSNSVFEIMRTETQQPFYQLKNLPVFKMRCELFDYNDEDFDTGIDQIDNVERDHAYKTILRFDPNALSGNFELQEQIIQINESYSISGEVVDIDASSSEEYLIYVAHQGEIGNLNIVLSNGGNIISQDNSSIVSQGSKQQYRTWSTNNPVTGSISGASGIPLLTTGDSAEILPAGAQNEDFDDIGDSFIDFTESNPFGDPR